EQGEEARRLLLRLGLVIEPAVAEDEAVGRPGRIALEPLERSRVRDAAVFAEREQQRLEALPPGRRRDHLRPRARDHLRPRPRDHARPRPRAGGGTVTSSSRTSRMRCVRWSPRERAAWVRFPQERSSAAVSRSRLKARTYSCQVAPLSRSTRGAPARAAVTAT